MKRAKEVISSITLIIFLVANWLRVLEHVDLLLMFLFGVITILYLLDDGIEDRKKNRRKIYQRKAKRSNVK